MKAKHLLLMAPILTLTACQSLREPAPGNALIEMVGHKQFILVAKDYPEFINSVAGQIVKLDTELAWANYRKMEVIKASKEKAAKKAPLPPVPKQ